MRTMFGKFLSLLCGLIIGAAILELGARVFLPSPTQVSVINVPTSTGSSDDLKGPVEIDVVNTLNTSDNQLYLKTPTGIRLRPNTIARINPHETCNCPAEIRTNSLGFRNPELGPKTRTRILFLGDSVTMADFIPEDQSWVRLVQTKSESSDRPVETVNGGIWATGLANHLALFLEKGLLADPDIVVLGFYLNDVEPSPGILLQEIPTYAKHSRAIFYALKALARFSKFSALGEPRSDYASVPEAEFKRWKEETKIMFPFKEPPQDLTDEFYRVVQHFFFDWGSAWSDGAWSHMKPIFQEFVRLAEVHNFKIVFAIFPVTDQVLYPDLYDYPQQKLKMLGAELGVPVIDVLPMFRKAYKEHQDRVLFYDWCHQTPYGQELLAEEMLRQLREKGLLD